MDREVVQANTEALQSLEKRLQVVQQILDEISNEVGWLCNNLNEVRPPEHVVCMECENKVQGLAEALRGGWKELMLHEGQYLGLCVECSEGVDIACHGCQTIERLSGADALKQGWTEVSECEEGYAGLCPACTEAEQEEIAVGVPPVLAAELQNCASNVPDGFPIEGARAMGLTDDDIQQAIAEGVTSVLGLRRIEKNNRKSAEADQGQKPQGMLF